MTAVDGTPSDAPTVVYAFGPFRLDLRARRLSRDGVAVPVSPKALDVLAVLVERAGRPVSKRELMDRVWPDVFVDEANLAQHVSMLRRTLGETSRDPRFIATIPRVGYQFVAEVDQAAPVARTPPAPSGSRRATDRRGAWLAMASGAVVIALVWSIRSAPPGPEPGPASRPDPAFARGSLLLARYTPPDSRSSREYFADLVARTPDDALAWARLADATVAMYLGRELRLDEALAQARTAVDRAAELAPEASATHEARASLLLQIRRDWQAAERELAAALAVDPSNASALDLRARGLRQAGRFAESIDAARAALALEPASVRAHANLATSIFFSGDGWPEVVALCLEALTLDRSHVPVRELLSDVYEASGRHAEAVDTRADLERQLGRPELGAALFRDYQRLGFRDAMAAYWKRKLELLVRTGPPVAARDFETLRAYARLGDVDRAIGILERMVDEGYNPGLLALAHHPMYAALQADPRFERLVSTGGPQAK